MERDFYIGYQSSNLDQGAQLNIRQPNLFPARMNPYSGISSNGLLPSAFTDFPLSMAGQPYETSNWFHSLSHFRHAQNSRPQKHLHTETSKEVERRGSLPSGTGCSQKQFIVFDQSGKQSTMLYSCKIGTPVNFMNSADQNLPTNWRKEDPSINRDGVFHLEPLLVGELDANQNDAIRSDMHEDTDELNALLYSDDDTAYDEETSTGHSPSNMTIPRMENQLKPKGEEVANSACSTKRQKLSDGGYDKPLAVIDTKLKDTASSTKSVACPETEDDTESSCVNAVNQVPRDFRYFSGKKRSRKEDMRKTIRILQKIIPEGKGKDTMGIIDEAIHYLQSLKSIAKDTGLAAF